MTDDDKSYRAVIDQLVRSCQHGQGQIASRRVVAGAWKPASDELNEVLGRLSGHDREIIARKLAEQFVGGVHEALVVLHEHGVEPFDRAYEGSPFHDFVGRLHGWSWPTDGRERE